MSADILSCVKLTFKRIIHTELSDSNLNGVSSRKSQFVRSAPHFGSKMLSLDIYKWADKLLSELLTHACDEHECLR